jgi:hypothetical protein
MQLARCVIDFYEARGIKVNYDTDHSNEVSLDSSVSTTDFWAIEKPTILEQIALIEILQLAYVLQAYKWVLYGTTVAGSPNK